MPTYPTPEPISVSLELGVADVRVVATDREDTNVEIRPSDPAKKGDVAAAEQARVDFSDGRLVVKANLGWRQYALRKDEHSIDVDIALPSGSTVRGEAALAGLHTSGALAECRYKTGAGSVHVEQAAAATLRTGAGDLVVGRTDGAVEAVTGSGVVRLGSVGGTAAVKNANGDTFVGDVAGDLRASSANGRIRVERSGGAVTAKTANGDVALLEAAPHAVDLQTGFGAIEVGIPEGVAAWLDLDTKYGTVDNRLAAAERPEPGEAVVEVRARTAFGDITVRRAVAAETAGADA